MSLDYAKIMYGDKAVHVPAWVVVQDQGNGVVSFVGASRGDGEHPLRFGSDLTHQLVVGEIIVRPHRVTASDACRGYGLEGLARDPHPLAEGERII